MCRKIEKNVAKKNLMVSYAPLLMHVMSADRLEKDINSQVTSWFAGSTSQHLTNKFAVVQLS